MQAHQAAHQRQPDAEPPDASIQGLPPLHEEVEDPGQQVGRNAAAVVPHLDVEVRGGVPGAHRDVATGRRVLGRVGQEIREDLREPGLVAVEHQRSSRRLLHHEVVAAQLQPMAGDVDRLRQRVVEIEPLPAQLENATRDARDVQQIVHQPDQVAGLPLQHIVLSRDVAASEPHQLQGAEHRRERVA